MFYLHPVDPSLFWSLILVIIFGIMIFGRKRLKSRKTYTRQDSAPTYTPAQSKRDYSAIGEVVKAHSDCTAEVVDVFVKGLSSVAISSSTPIGSKVELSLQANNLVHLIIKGNDVATLYLLPSDSRIPLLLRNGTSVECFLGGRDVSALTSKVDFISIIAFYKMQGVPPTKVEIK